MMQRFFQLAETRPVVFNVVSATAIFGLGDFIQQKLDLNYLVLGKRSKITDSVQYNYYQTFKMMTYAFIMSPMNHFFYTKFLTKIAPLSAKPSGPELVKKVFADYTIYAST